MKELNHNKTALARTPEERRILIVMHAMELGGAERALLGLLELLAKSNIQVDLFLLRHEGELLKDIPEDICVLPESPSYTVLARPMKQTIKEGHLLLTGARLYGRYRAKRYVKKNKLGDNGVGLEYSHKYTWRLLPKIEPNVVYDLAISFLTPHYVVAHKVKARKKICWIHTDYSTLAVDRESELAMWGMYDNIIAISEDVQRGFVQQYPSLSEKLVLIENILPVNLIRRQSKERIPAGEMEQGKIKLLSIGRFSYAKNFDNVPDICRRIRASGLDVCWYLIGFGPDEELILSKIRENEMQDYVIILGKKENPYPYIKACDVYVQPSRYEGKCVAVREAQLLEKPVVITNYATSASQLEDDVDGIITPSDNEGCAKKIINLLNDTVKQNQLILNCRASDHANSAEIDKLYKLMQL